MESDANSRQTVSELNSIIGTQLVCSESWRTAWCGRDTHRFGVRSVYESRGNCMVCLFFYELHS